MYVERWTSFELAAVLLSHFLRKPTWQWPQHEMSVLQAALKCYTVDLQQYRVQFLRQRTARLSLPGRVQPASSEVVAPHNRLVHVYRACSPRTLLSITLSATTTKRKKQKLSHMRGSRVPARAVHNMLPCAQWRLMRAVVPADVISIAAAQELHWGQGGG